MDEEKVNSAAPEKKPNTRRRRRKMLRRLLAGAVTLVLVVAGLLAIVYRDRLTEDGLRETFGQGSLPEESAPFAYETGSDQVFALAGDGFAVASASSVQLLDSRGKTVYKELVSFHTPGVFACGEKALFCDIGGTDCIVADFKGETTALELDGAVLSAHMNESGWFAIISEEAGYKGLVQVYDNQCQLIYKWWSGTGYALKAAVSPDNKHLAVLTVDDEGGKLHLFSLSSENELHAVPFPGDLLFDLHYMSASTLCAISEEAAYFISDEGDIKGRYDFGDQYLSDYAFGSGSFAAVCLNSYRSGTGGTILTLDSSGTALGSAALEGDIIALSAQEEQLLVLSSGDLRLYARDMSLSEHAEGLATVRSALLRPKGDVLLLSAYSAEEFKF